MAGTNSRYARSAIVTMPAADGLDVAYIATRRDRCAGIRGEHRTRSSDRPDLLGWRATGDPTAFWMVADVNGVLDPDELAAVPGRTIAMPAAD